MVVHALAEETGTRVLAANHAADGLADLIAVDAKIRVFARGKKCHQGHARDARPLLSTAAFPVPLLGLSLDEILQATIVHFANVARHGLADMLDDGLRI